MQKKIGEYNGFVLMIEVNVCSTGQSNEKKTKLKNNLNKISVQAKTPVSDGTEEIQVLFHRSIE